MPQDAAERTKAAEADVEDLLAVNRRLRRIARELQRHLARHPQASQLREAREARRERLARELVQGGPSDEVHPVTLPIRVSPELLDILHGLAADYRISTEGAVLLAIGLLKIARDARREGKRLAIVDADGEIDQEIEDV